MAFPTETAFDAWLSVAREAPAKRLWLEIYAEFKLLPRSGAPTPEFLAKVKHYLDSRAPLVDELCERLERLPLNRWLLKQPGFKRAQLQLWKTPPIANEDLTRHNQYIDDRAQQGHFAYGYVNRLFLWSPLESWMGSLVTALHEYHYTDNADQMHGLAKDSKKIFSSFEVARTRLLQLLSLVGRPNGVEFRMLERLTLEDWRRGVYELPIHRDSQYKSEHLFVYRMWKANRSFARKQKPEVIGELMTIGGFRHEFDARTLQRLFSKFKAAEDRRKGQIPAGARSQAA